MSAGQRQATITIPKDLLERVDRAVRDGKAGSRNGFVERALRRELAAQERHEIDAAFASMAHDTEYQDEVSRLSKEFSESH